MTGLGDGRLDPSGAAWLRETERAAPASVLDSFGGAGTFGLVAERLARHSIIVEINANDADLAHKRVAGDAPLSVQTQVAA